jgi:hypothetical protein
LLNVISSKGAILRSPRRAAFGGTSFMILPDDAAKLAPSGLASKGEWFRNARPYTHVRATNVFSDEVYQRLERSFQTILQDTHAGKEGVPVFRKATSGYDAWMLEMTPSLTPAFEPLFSERWMSYLAGVMNVPAAPEVDGALHHIPRGSRSGYIHTDFCSAWFDAGTRENRPRFPSRRLVDYFSGRPREAVAQPEEFIRIVTMIYYLCNDGWRPDHGGETGLFPTGKAGMGQVKPCPPLNNSLLLFECSPHSHHALLANLGSDRNSVILWLHCGVDYAISKWGNAVKRRRP